MSNRRLTRSQTRSASQGAQPEEEQNMSSNSTSGPSGAVTPPGVDITITLSSSSSYQQEEVLVVSDGEDSDLEVELVLSPDSEESRRTNFTRRPVPIQGTSPYNNTLRLSSLAMRLANPSRRLNLLRQPSISSLSSSSTSSGDVPRVVPVAHVGDNDDNDVIVVNESDDNEVQDSDDGEIEILNERSESNPVPSTSGNQSANDDRDIDSGRGQIINEDNSTTTDNNDSQSAEAAPAQSQPLRNVLQAIKNEDNQLKIQKPGPGDTDDEDDDSRPPPQKIPRLDRSDNDDDGFICTICYENFTNSGDHRVCCLKCGHVFGRECIEKWILTNKRCPQCNCKAFKKDIRIIYVKNLQVVDTTELDRLKAELERSRIEKNRVDLTNAQLRVQVQLKTQEITRLQAEAKSVNSRSSRGQPEVIDLEQPGTSKNLQESGIQSSYSALRMPKLQPIKRLDIKEGQCRVGAYNEWMNLLVVSHGITNALFPGGSFGIKKINCLDMKPFQSFPIHSKTLRDMSFSLAQDDLLLTVGLDKKAVLFNCNSNCAVQTFDTPTQLWSCCWNSVNQNIFYVGSNSGHVVSYDIRAPQQPLSILAIPTTDKSGVIALKFVPPAYQNQPFNMSGLIIQKLNSVWFAEMLGGTDPDPRYHQLPLEGPFLNADFEPSSRHVLVSSRPKLTPNRLGSTHLVCSLGKTYSEMEQRDIFSCDVVHNITGGFQESTMLCRSSIFSPQQDRVYVTANGEGIGTARVWDVANTEQKALVRLNYDTALDFIHGKVNDTRFLAFLTEKSMDIYDVK